MITVTFIRHGESEDNLRNIWAGWKDAPLSELGRKQAYALGEYLSSTPITHMYASPSLRAHATAQFVHQHQPHPKPLLKVNPNLREQHFGAAEGNTWVLDAPEGIPIETLYEQKIFPVLHGLDEKFPGGESLNDLARRAEVAIQECVWPHLPHIPVSEDQSPGIHVALASHGLCIGQMVSALIRLDPEADQKKTYYGLKNTAWTRMDIRVRDGPVDPANPLALQVRVTHHNHREHLNSLKDLPPVHEEVDGARAEARAFFGGEKIKAGIL